MSIRSYVDEMEELQLEIKRNNATNRRLRQRVKELEANISDYLANKGQSGLKYNGKAIVVEDKEQRPARKKKDKEEKGLNFFEHLGVHNPQEAYSRFLETQRGSPVRKQKLKIKKLPNF